MAEAFLEHALELKPEQHLGAQDQQARFVQGGLEFSFQLHACPVTACGPPVGRCAPLFRSWLLELASSLDQPPGALGLHRFHEGERGVLDLGLEDNVAVERFMAARIGFEIADVAVVANLFDVVPILMEEIKRAKS